jgi:hypothetical protein
MTQKDGWQETVIEKTREEAVKLDYPDTHCVFRVQFWGHHT